MNDIGKYLNNVDYFMCYIKSYIKPADNMIDTKSFMSMSKTILLIILNIYFNRNNDKLNRPLITLNSLLKLFSLFDKIQFIRFVHYFVDYMLDIFIDIYNKDNKHYDDDVRNVLNTLINGIIGLDKPIREKLLGKFDKWFILTLREFGGNKGMIFDLNHMGSGVENYYDSYLNSYQHYFKEEVSINFLIEKLSWFSSHDVDMEILLFFINKTNKYISARTKPFSDIVKLHLASNIITNMCYKEKGDMIMPVNYQYLLDKIESEGNEYFCAGIESLVYMYSRKYY